MATGISLSNKSQLLFGFAVLMILAAALAVPWVRTIMLVREGQFEAARQTAEAWLTDQIQLGTLERATGRLRPVQKVFGDPENPRNMRMALTSVDAIDLKDQRDSFVGDALRAFQDDSHLVEYTGTTDVAQHTVYRYARVVRQSQMLSNRGAVADSNSAKPSDGDSANPISAILIIDRTGEVAEGMLLRNRIYILADWTVASLLAVLVFYLILTKIILQPVRKLRATTEKVQAGDLTIRSEIKTGDEFEELADAFNSMLDRVQQSQARLESLNQSLDLKLTELSEANIGLYESNRLKGEFLANVSHELRTPLNSIIGFTEVLDELASADEHADPKRMRYIQNILTSGRSLLEMINELLEMAKIEAGRLEVNIESASVSDLIEGLIGIMGPQAKSKNITLVKEVSTNLPLIETDPGKLQQILYNFLTNAIKFTPEGGTVTITGDRITRQDANSGIRLGVADTGPGIPYDMQDAIFEKFRQVDAGHTREHTGTGLGLAICRELADLLGAAVSLVSEPDHGATFYVDLPLTHQPEQPQPLMA
ncbi:MAG: HAMP domain-containing histidine kinase [Planctomycetes bacterium]|nr:HAMP domain-containing histidine kinase [Planctomycetota bacterium]